jgi:hypothetical protein
MSIYAEWIAAKEAERQAVEYRRALEDQMAVAFDVREDLDGTANFEDGGYRVKIVGRINRTVDGDLLQELAAEHDLSQHLADLFRWKPEVNAKTWSAAADSITRPLSAAITARPGRPSFTITKKEEN